MQTMAKPFVCNYTNQNKCICQGCTRQLEGESLRLGVCRIKGETGKRSIDYYHFLCFWEKCPYRHHLKGSNSDSLTLSELVDGFDSLLSVDRLKLSREAKKPSEKIKGRLKGLVAKRDGDLSAESGDYDISENMFDLANLVCVYVFKHQLDVLISIREYFKPNQATVALATRIGITLTVEQWLALCKEMIWIDESLDEVGDAAEKPERKKPKSKKKKEESQAAPKEEKEKEGPKVNDGYDGSQIVYSLSWKRRVSVFRHHGKAAVDIRDYSEGSTFEPMMKKGITLSRDQWNKLKEHEDSINSVISELSK